MKIRFNRTTTVDLNDAADNKTFHRNDVVEVLDIEPISKNFFFLTLKTGDVLIDVRGDCFEEVT